ncbi:ubiquitin-specific protease UBP15 [Aspergillus lucknowensis]|uniref:ubiquitinyl hydrolase 1 n=1 Tax=Aspergillus lucknowensis TaxID=176173 RepID=A0ABR4LFR1_9EURO
MDNVADNEMLVDEYEQFHQDRTDDVVVSQSGSEEPEAEPPADDYPAMMARLLPKDPDLETIEETWHTWHIQDWRKLKRREHGPVFNCGEFPWRVLFFPYGNHVEHASFYLEHAWENEPPENWYACVQFALVLWNVNDPSIYITHVATHRFNADEGDWGFTRFCELRRLFNMPWEGRGVPLVQNDEANVTAYVRVVKDPTGVLWHTFQNYDSKKETGMVGMKNQGATCYLNSLLQSLYFTNAFRKAVYQIPTESEASKDNHAWTLQRLFNNIQTSDTAVSTIELTASFGWDLAQHSLYQQDIQEASRILMDKLEEKMKGTPAEGTLTELFVGKTKTYISCINVDYESSRVEDFWDIQLSVRGNKNLDDCFKDYIRAETLEGENKYDAGAPYGLQDAKKGMIFESFPPVLHLHLMRFMYDLHRDATMKINDRVEFPMEFDASPYLSKDADMSESWVYQLYGVLVHSGGLDAGHYFAFLRPTKDGFWYRFDDERVSRATDKEIFEDGWGGEYELPNGAVGVRQPYTRGLSTKRTTNAYMLVYLRKSKLDDILIPITKEDAPPHIEKRLAEERAEYARKKKEKEEAHLYLNVGVLSEDTFRHHNGFDLTSFDQSTDEAALPKPYRILRTTKVSDFAEMVAEERDINPRQLRFWVMVNRQNKTMRPDQVIKDPEMTVEEAYSRYGTKGNPFRVWLEIGQPSSDGTVSWPDSTQSVLVFLKHFDVQKQTLTGVRAVYVRKNSKVAELAPTILETMAWPAGTEFVLYEEIKHNMIELMKPKQTFQQSEIQDGDIITFQKSLKESDIPASALYTDAKFYYDYLLNRITVTFAPLRATESDEFSLVLSRKMTYDQFSKKVGEHLNVDYTHLRFAPVVGSTGKPKPFIKRNSNQNAQTLQSILFAQMGGYTINTHRNDALYYEVLETSLSEYESKISLPVTWLPEGISKEQTVDVLVPRDGTISDVLSGLQKKAGLDDESILNARVYETHNHRISRELQPDSKITSSYHDYVTIYAEKVPDDESNLESGARTINAYNFDKETNRTHGVPFKFVVKPGEIFKETKERLSERTGLKGKRFEKIKFAVVQRLHPSSPRYLEDDDILSDIIGDSDDLLGLDHPNNKNRSFWNQGQSFFIR